MVGKWMDVNNVGGIEKGLDFIMTPVDPDPEFVRNLGVRLRYPKSVTIEADTYAKPTALLLLLAGMIFGIVTVFLLRKLR